MCTCRENMLHPFCSKQLKSVFEFTKHNRKVPLAFIFEGKTNKWDSTSCEPLSESHFFSSQMSSRVNGDTARVCILVSDAAQPGLPSTRNQCPVTNVVRHDRVSFPHGDEPSSAQHFIFLGVMSLSFPNSGNRLLNVPRSAGKVKVELVVDEPRSSSFTPNVSVWLDPKLVL